MTYSILDSGDLVASFDEVDAAHHALERLAAVSPNARERLLLVAINANGEIVADCVPGERVAHAV
jgi:hypothetical protein